MNLLNENCFSSPKIEAVLFDMDGVIFDSERCCFEIWREIAQKYNLQGFDSVYEKLIGVNAYSCRRIFLEAYGETVPFDAFRKEANEEFARRYGGGRLPLKSGIRELLEMLKGKSVWLEVASSNETEVISQRLKNADLEKFFNHIVGGDCVQQSKPAPDIFLSTLKESDVSPLYAMVVEDSYNGIRAAAAGNMIPVMVPDLQPPNQEMKKLARVIVPDLICLRDMLLNAEKR